MKKSPRKEPSECEKSVFPAVKDFQKCVKRIGRLKETSSKEERESREADACLSSRSAYFDLYSWIIVHGTVDPHVERTLDQVFQDALKVMRSETYKPHVQRRYEECKEVCERTRQAISDISPFFLSDSSSFETVSV